MHERSIVQSLLRQVEQLMCERQAARVVDVCLSVGEFSGVEPELVELAYEELVEDSSARGAELRMERVPLEARCDACGKQFTVERFCFQCPSCHDARVTVVRGEGLVLESVTMEGCDP